MTTQEYNDALTEKVNEAMADTRWKKYRNFAVSSSDCGLPNVCLVYPVAVGLPEVLNPAAFISFPIRRGHLSEDLPRAFNFFDKMNARIE